MMAIASRGKWESLQGLLDIIYPPLCLGCGEYVVGSESICPHCMDRIEKFVRPLCLDCLQPLPPYRNKCPICPPETPLLFSYGNYRPVLQEVIIQFKFAGITSPADIFAPLIVAQFGDSIRALNPDCLIPIPLHRFRERYRGYNQAELLAEELSALLDIPIDDELIERVKRSRPQTKVSFHGRERNVKGIFFADADHPIGRVILVDDVVTTGATIKEAVRVVKQAGGEVVAAISIAHGI